MNEKILQGLLIATIILGGGYLVYSLVTPSLPLEDTEVAVPDIPQVSETAYRVVYWTFEGDVERPGGINRTYKLWYQDSGGTPVTIDKVFGNATDKGPFIRATQVTNDGKAAYLIYKYKIEKVEVDTGKVSLVMTTNDPVSIYGMSLNNNESALLVSSAARGDYDTETYLDEINLESLTSRRIFSGNTPWGLSPLAQNDQGIWLVQHPRPTEGFIYGTFDANTGELSDTTGYVLVDNSPNWIVLSYDSTSEPHVCSLSGEVPTARTIINPFTGDKLGVISSPGKHIRISEFSADGTRVLILVKDIPDINEFDPSMCGAYWDKENGWELFATDVTDSERTVVANVGEAYELWYPNQKNPFVDHTGNVCTATLLDGQTVTLSCEGRANIGILRTVETNRF